jgi:hypothetical protein
MALLPLRGFFGLVRAGFFFGGVAFFFAGAALAFAALGGAPGRLDTAGVASIWSARSAPEP